MDDFIMMKFKYFHGKYISESDVTQFFKNINEVTYKFGKMYLTL